MKGQLAVKDGQIASLTKLTTNAQTLNLLDKSNSETNVKNKRVHMDSFIFFIKKTHSGQTNKKECGFN